MKRLGTRGSWAFAGALMLAGCATVGPDYHAPPPPAGIAEKPTAFAEGNSPAFAAEPLPDRWWRLYAIPQLDALVEEAIRANTDLRIAAANDLFEFRDAIAVLPKSMPRVHRMMEFVDIHALYADRSGVDRISPQSIKKYLGAVQALLGFAFQERFSRANSG